MARLFTSGFELNSTTANMEWDNVVGTATVVNTNVASGGFAGRLVDGGGAGSRWERRVTSANVNGPWYVRVRIRAANLGTGVAYASGNRIISLNSDSGVPMAQIRLNTDGTLELWDSTAQIGSDSAALSTNTYYRVEFYVFNNTVSGKLELTARIDGTDFATTTTSANTGTMQYIRLGEMMGTAGTAQDIQYDDVAVNDTSGTAQTSWPGDSKVILLSANAAGDVNTFATQTGGTAGAANNFTRVDEIPPNDVTDFNGSSTLNEEDMFNMTDSGIGASDTVNVVEVYGRFRNSTADGTAAIRFQIEKAASGTKTQSASIVPNSTTWKTNATGSPWTPSIILYLDPDAGAWTQTTLDSMQTGYKLQTAPGVGGRRIDVSAVYAQVDYSVAVATAMPSRMMSMGMS